MRKSLSVLLVALLLLGAVVWLLEAFERRDRSHFSTGEPPNAGESASPGSLQSVDAPSVDARVALDVRDSSAPSSVEPSVAGSTTRSGIVIHVGDSDNHPIADALLRLDASSSADAYHTDANGTCVLPLESAGQAFTMTVEAPGHVHRTGSWLRRPRLDIVLPIAVELYGHIRESETKACVPTATIQLVHEFCRGCAPVVVQADAAGFYRIGGVPTRERARFVIGSSEFPEDTFFLNLPCDTLVVKHDFELSRGMPVVFRVIDLYTGEPIPGARVANRARTGDVMVCDASGEWRGNVLLDSGTDTLQIKVSADGRGDLIASVRESVLRETLLLPLPGLAYLAGSVSDEAGTPVPEATLRLLQPPAHLISFERGSEAWCMPMNSRFDEWNFIAAVSDQPFHPNEFGRYRAPGGLPWTQGWVLEVSHPACEPQRLASISLGGPGDSILNVVLRRR